MQLVLLRMRKMVITEKRDKTEKLSECSKLRKTIYCRLTNLESKNPGSVNTIFTTPRQTTRSTVAIEPINCGIPFQLPDNSGCYHKE